MDHQNSLLSYNDYDYNTYEGLEKTMNGLRKGPWSEEEDSKLISSINIHGEGKWNTLAILAGLKRSGKSCRLRWVNYLHPNLQRGAFTLQEQLLILELHLRWGNRWSKIAEVLPGRTDNNIKNYWRTKVQKLAKQYDCNVNSSEFRDAIRHVWIPRLSEQIQASNNTNSSCSTSTTKLGCNYEYGGLSDDHDLYSMPNMIISNCSDNEPIISTEICSSSSADDELWDGINWDQIDHFLREMQTLDDDQQASDVLDTTYNIQQQLDNLASKKI